MAATMRNTLFYGGNLPILREYVDTESVDLVYLDPPFNPSRSYNVLFRDEGGRESEAQITAFEDTWHWNNATEHTYHELITLGEPHVSAMIKSGDFRDLCGALQRFSDFLLDKKLLRGALLPVAGFAFLVFDGICKCSMSQGPCRARERAVAENEGA